MSIQFPITIKVFTEPAAVGASYIAHIPEFDISSCGKTEKQAVDNVKEALEGVLDEVKAQDKLDEYLRYKSFW